MTIRLHRLIDRDAARTPMPWTAGAGAGFTVAGAEPWLPFGDVAACNVADQRDDPDSTLHLTRDLLSLRKERADLRTGAYRTRVCEGSVWAWQRGNDVLVALNLGPKVASIDDVEGSILLGTDRGRDGARVTGVLTLGAYEGVVLSRTA